MNRREFLARTGAAAALAAAPSLLRQGSGGQAWAYPAAEKLNIAAIGIGGRGRENLRGVQHQNIVALCDVDERTLERVAAEIPGAKKHVDFRRMLEQQKDIEAVVVSTADHCHAPAGVMAMKLGKHCYCEKPLTHSVFEARLMAETAAKMKVATQMGTQIHASENYRRVVELVQAGAIGKIEEVHVWVGGDRIWAAEGLPKETPPVPKHLHWDVWLGPAPERPYSPAYQAMGWRSYWNFGGGHLGDMGCHYMDLAFWALNLRHPLTAEAEGPGPADLEGAPRWLIARWTFPARGDLPPVRLTWHHGEKRPPGWGEDGVPKWGAGVLFVGQKGKIAANYPDHKLLPEEKFKDFKRPEPSIEKSAGHHEEWIRACRGGGKTLCNFDYSGALTETVLLGNVAYRTGKRLEWDAAALKAKNCREADRFLRRDYRAGWTL